MSSQEEEMMSTTTSCKNSAMKELAQAKDSLTRLASLLQIGSPENSRPAAASEILVIETMSAINNAAAALECGEKMEVNQVRKRSTKKDGIGEQSKMQRTRKGGYRKRGSPSSWTKTTSKTIDDGYTWRKYGQKDIFSAKYPRSYFRCTHKFDQGCKASKQVQRSEDDESLFVITYLGEHTCADPRNAAIVPSGRPCIISFESSNGENVKQETLSSLPSLNQESEEEVLSNLTSADSTSDNFVSGEQAAAVLEHNGLPSASNPYFMDYYVDYSPDFMEGYLNFDYMDMF